MYHYIVRSMDRKRDGDARSRRPPIVQRLPEAAQGEGAKRFDGDMKKMDGLKSPLRVRSRGAGAEEEGFPLQRVYIGLGLFFLSSSLYPVRSFFVVSLGEIFSASLRLEAVSEVSV